MKLVIGDVHWGVRNASEFYLDKQLEFFESLFDDIDKYQNGGGNSNSQTK